jgi:dCTP diphosphatase
MTVQQHTDKTTTVQELKQLVDAFVKERDWSQFHDAKNLSMVIGTEAAELMELLRWAKSDEVDELVQKHKDEIAFELIDVLWACICFANKYDIDLASTLQKKSEINEERYPAAQARGKADKYTSYQKK